MYFEMEIFVNFDCVNFINEIRYQKHVTNKQVLKRYKSLKTT